MVLVALALGLFLLTSSQTRPTERWSAGAEILVPHRDEEGELPEGVPPQLLQGQEGLALSESTTDLAMDRLDLDDAARDEIEFDFTTNEQGDIYTLTVAAPTEGQAEDVSHAFADAYMAARRQRVAASARQESDAARRSAESLRERLSEVEDELGELAPDVLATLPDVAETEEPTPNVDGEEEEIASIDLPPSTPEDVELLVYERQDLLRQLENVRKTYARGSTESIVPSAFASVITRSAPEDVTREPLSPLVPIAVACGLAALLAVAVPVLLDRVDHSIRDTRAAGNALAAPILSTIPASPSTQAALARPGTVSAQAYQTLAAASVATDQLPRAIVVTAPVGDTQDGVAANFAAALADLGLRVALVGTQSGQSWYGQPPDGGPTLPDFLAVAHSGRLNGEVPDHLVTTDIPNLRVLPPGDTEAEVLVDGLPLLLRSLADAGVDVTVIAAPSILEDSSATIMAWSTRSVLWVVETGAVTEQQASEAAARLELAGASPFGVAVVQRNG